MPDGFCRCFVGAPGWGRGAGPTAGSEPVIHAGVVAPRPRPAGPVGRGAGPSTGLGAGPSTGRGAGPTAGASLGGAATGRGAGPTAGASLGGAPPG